MVELSQALDKKQGLQHIFKQYFCLESTMFRIIEVQILSTFMLDFILKRAPIDDIVHRISKLYQDCLNTQLFFFDKMRLAFISEMTDLSTAIELSQMSKEDVVHLHNESKNSILKESICNRMKTFWDETFGEIKCQSKCWSRVVQSIRMTLPPNLFELVVPYTENLLTQEKCHLQTQHSSNSKYSSDSTS